VEAGRDGRANKGKREGRRPTSNARGDRRPEAMYLSEQLA